MTLWFKIKKENFMELDFKPSDQVIIILLIHQGFEGSALRGGYCHVMENTQLNNIIFFLSYIIINFSILNSCCLLL